MKRLLLASLVLAVVTGCGPFKVNSWYEGYNAHYRPVAPGESFGFDGDKDLMTQTPVERLHERADGKIVTADETCDMDCCKEDAKK